MPQRNNLTTTEKQRWLLRYLKHPQTIADLRYKTGEGTRPLEGTLRALHRQGVVSVDDLGFWVRVK